MTTALASPPIGGIGRAKGVEADMVGVVAMASVVEDFETQPCKKQREDVETPAKTIASYFLPVPKAGEKPFSPPRSNNIMSYFKKTPPATCKSSTLDKAKETADQTPETLGKTKTHRLSREKPPGKGVNLSKQLNGIQMKSREEVVVIADSSNDSCSVVQSGREELVTGILGSDTAALLAQISADNYVMEDIQEETTSCQTLRKDLEEKVLKTPPKKRKFTKKKQKMKPESEDKPPQVLLEKPLKEDEEKGKDKPSVKTKSGVKQAPRVQVSRESDSALCETSLEGNQDGVFSLNDSTVTISFEEFLESQKEGGASASPAGLEAERREAVEQSPPLQLSPRIVTTQAQVHRVFQPPGSAGPAKKPQKKIASIFCKNRRDDEVQFVEIRQLAWDENAEQAAPKRKSNVVMEEEELELAVIETAASSPPKPKCTLEEKKQFMDAFKKPTPDGSKSRLKKGPSKQKEATEKAVNQQEEGEKCHRTEKDEEQESDSATEKGKDGKLAAAERRGGKLTKKGRKCAAKAEEDAANTVTAEEVLGAGKNLNQEEAVEQRSTAVTPVPAEKTNRKLTRGGAKQKSAGSTPSTNMHQGELAARHNKLSQDSPVQVSTPRMSRLKGGAYSSEMITVPDDTQSPISPRGSRKAAGGEDSEMTPRSSKKKNTLKAKKLVQKAKTLKQKSSKGSVESAESLRRSSRQQDLPTRKSYYEDEDSVVMVEDLIEDCSPASDVLSARRNQKKLRSLNDVLGKNVAPKNSADSKAALCKKAPKTGVISIFDDSSRDDSENSQGDEQFRAKRDFLKSGLPDTLKRQIAKTAASREVYSIACASFQAVTHVLQRSPECAMWTLTWPSSPLLKQLREDSDKLTITKAAKCVISLGEFTDLKSRSTSVKPTIELSGWRVDFSEEVKKCLLEEIRSSNPPFPVRRFYNWFMKKRTEHLLLPIAAAPDPEEASCLPVDQQQTGRKRKRCEDGGEGDKAPKRKRASRGESAVILIGDSPENARDRPARRGRGAAAEEACREAPVKGRLSRGSRHKQKQQDDVIVLEDNKQPASDAAKQDSVKEDVLWTEKYQPQHSSEVIGNSVAVKKLHSWLKEWKLRADREEKKKQKEKKQEKEKSEAWDDDDFKDDQSEDELEDLLCNTVLITGPPGVGKTAAVYACAQELGFKVFEVNASSQRSGRQILSQLKEATQSHQVDIQGVNAHKPSYFSSSSTVSKSLFNTITNSPKKVNSPRKVVSSPRKPPQSPRGAGPKKRKLAPTALADFFNVKARAKDKEKGKPGKEEKHVDEEKLQKPPKAKKGGTQEKEALATKPASENKAVLTEEPSKKTATSLILFEEVDVIFEDDSGFLAAIKTFMTTAKRPVILTTSDPTFNLMFDGCFEEIHFKTPSVVNVASYLQLLCLTENLRTDVKDFSSLLALNNCDIRQSLLHLQFWTRTGGGSLVDRPLSVPAVTESHVEKNGPVVRAGAKQCAESKPVCLQPREALRDVPKCDVGCSENLLGLQNVAHSQDLLSVLQPKTSTAGDWTKPLQLLAECRGTRLDFTYSNLELLLPLPVRFLPESNEKPPAEEADPEPEPMALSQKADIPLESVGSAEPSPLKVSSRMKRKRRLELLLDDRDLFQSDSDSEDSFQSLPPTAPTSHAKENPIKSDAASKPAFVKPVKKPQTPAEHTCSRLVSQCLDSLSEFLDHMSFLDSSLLKEHVEKEGPCKWDQSRWSAAEIKNGLSDERRSEGCDWWGSRSSAEIKVAVEALSFQKCRTVISEAMEGTLSQCKELGKDPTEELTLPVSAHRNGVSFIQSAPCKPSSVVHKRAEIMKTVFSNKSFISQGNRQAAVVDYLPTLRAICRAEKLKEKCRVKRRFLHYLKGMNLDLPKQTVDALAADFP
ncbi:ATPase family AAA domain-containing protein 5-like isoform X2 [Acipenser ruthenus]|uniref:ATPase family AAA domain-containing protein 5-like isoform X2 n=1 Tax=Acipenser ruthenus TaxID=7906 RepID=UPI002741B719|nr:ATPase family AAA domain-containing protein 5-like isoform X2 [Acipenser ruthenus]